jgi:hypothetical protein
MGRKGRGEHMDLISGLIGAWVMAMKRRRKRGSAAAATALKLRERE